MYKHFLHPPRVCIIFGIVQNYLTIYQIIGIHYGSYAGKLVFVYILRGKMNCLTEFNFVKIWKMVFLSYFVLYVSNYKLNLHRIDFAFSIIFHIQFHCLRTYFIHQDSTRCETCNILNPIFLYL